MGRILKKRVFIHYTQVIKFKYGHNRKTQLETVQMALEELQIAPMHRLIKKAGAERVSEEAANELRAVLEEIGIKISKEAFEFAVYAGRKTVKAEDIKIAVRKIIKE